MKREGCAVLLLFAVVLVMDQARPARNVEAKQLIFHEPTGHEKLAIGSPRAPGAATDLAPDDAVVWIVGDSGIDRAILTGDGLRFSDEKGRPLRSYLAKPIRAAP